MNWYYAKNGTQHGPLPTEDMKSRIDMGEISGTDLAWTEGMADWMPVATIAALKVEERPAKVEFTAPASALPSNTPEPYRPPSTAAPQAPAYTGGQPPSQGMAIAALICGIIAFVGCCAWFISAPMALVAIVLGHIAISKVKADPQRYSGKGMARAGLVTGYLGLIGAIAFGFMWSQLNGLSEPEMQEKVLSWFPISEEQRQEIRQQMEKQRQERDSKP